MGVLKTHIIQLEPHDNLISIRDKMSWAKSSRILVIWAVPGHVPIRPLDVKLLQRHANALGAQIGFVTREWGITRVANEHKIPVFSNIADSQTSSWGLSQEYKRLSQPNRHMNFRSIASELRKQELGRWNQPGSKVIVFSMTIFVIFILLISFIPSAEIHLTLQPKIQELTAPIKAWSRHQQANPAGEVPLHQIVINTSVIHDFNANGRMIVPTKKAIGSVQFRNLTESSILVPEGTIVLAIDPRPVRFVTVESVYVSPGNDNSPTISIEAIEPGVNGNLGPGSVRAIEGHLGLSLTVTNPDPTHGGADRRVPVLTDSDKSLAREILLADLQQEAIQKGKKSLSPDDLPLSIVKVNLDSLVEQVDLILGTSSYSYKLSGDVVFYYLPADELAILAGFFLDHSLPPGYIPAPDSVSYEIIGDPVLADDNSIDVIIRFQRNIIPRIEKYSFIHSIQGRNHRRAVIILKNKVTFMQDLEIKISPSWWPWLPMFPFQYEISN